MGKLKKQTACSQIIMRTQICKCMHTCASVLKLTEFRCCEVPIAPPVSAMSRGPMAIGVARAGLLESFHILLTLFVGVVCLVVCASISLTLSLPLLPPLPVLLSSGLSISLSPDQWPLSLSCLLLGSICLHLSPLAPLSHSLCLCPLALSPAFTLILASVSALILVLACVCNDCFYLLACLSACLHACFCLVRCHLLQTGGTSRSLGSLFLAWALAAAGPMATMWRSPLRGMWPSKRVWPVSTPSTRCSGWKVCGASQVAGE